MQILIKQAKIYDSQSDKNHQVYDILIADGVIKQIEKSINQDVDYTIEAKNLGVSVGWFDGMVSFGEPGFEERETLEHGLQVAAKSGFTNIVLQPSTNPVIDNASQVAWIKQKVSNHLVKVLPVGALTKQSLGEHMAELYDMHLSGAVGFSDYKSPITNSLLLKICLQYIKDFDGLIVPFSQDSFLVGKGYVNEGVAATKLGLKGIPSIAEAVAIARNLTLLKYTGGKMHIPLISTKEGVELIKQAKDEGLNVTCSVAAQNLVLNDEVLNDFDSNYKVMPPLRDDSTRKALIEAVNNNIIDVIVSDHFPLNIEHKKLEFDHATFGTIGLESLFGSVNNVIDTNNVISKLTNGYNIFGQTRPTIEIGAKANLTCFDTSSTWNFEPKHVLSTSKNSAFYNVAMKGKPIASINNNQISL